MSNAERIQRQREQELGRVASGRAGQLVSPCDVDVVGVTFVSTYPDNILSLEMLAMEAELVGERLAAIIVRNPDNKFDSNACEVHVPSLGDHGMIGHLPAAIAARLAPELDTGVLWQAGVARVRLQQEHLDRPGITIHMERQ